MPKSGDSIKKATILSIVTNYLGLPLSIVISIIISRTLGPEIKGQYSIYLATLGFLSVPGFAVQTSLVRYLAYEKPPWQQYKNFINKFVLFQTAITGGLLLLILQSKPINYYLLSGMSNYYSIPIILTLLISFWYFYISTVFPAIQQLSKGIKSTFYSSIITKLIVAFPLIFFFLAGMEITLNVIIFFNLTSIIVSAGYWYWITNGIYYKPKIDKIDPRQALSSIAVLAVPILGKNLVEWGNQRIDVYFINAFLSQKDIGLYSVAVGLLQNLSMITISLSGPVFARIASQGQSNESEKLGTFSYKIALYLSIITGILAAIFLPFLIPLVYGKAFAFSSTIFLYLLPGIIFLGPTRQIYSYFHGINQGKFPLYAEVFGFVFTIGMNILLIPRIGVFGAAAASVTSYGIAFFIASYAYMKKANVPIKNMWLFNDHEKEYIRNFFKAGKRKMLAIFNTSSREERVDE